MSSVIFSGSSLSQPLAKLSEEVIRWCPIEKFVLPSRPVKSVIWFHVKSILMSLLTSLNFSREVILSPDKSKSVSPPKVCKVISAADPPCALTMASGCMYHQS